MDRYDYTFEYADGSEAPGYFEHGQAEQALAFGRKHRLNVIRNTYAWDDSDLIERNAP